MRQLRIKKLLHTSLIVADIRRAMEFYCGVLGLTPSDNRPNMNFPGVWFELGAQQLHLLEVHNPDPISGRPQHPGRDRHVALSVNDVDVLIQQLSKHDIAYNMSHSGRRALFTRDPDGNGLEFVETTRSPSLPAAPEPSSEPTGNTNAADDQAASD